jgi:hypothetical protein
MAGIRQLVRVYKSFDSAGIPLSALINGHSDLQGAQFPEHNRGLSAERAESIAAYLADDVEAWMKWYAGRPNSTHWGVREDQLMLAELKDDSGAPFYAGTIDGGKGPQTLDAYHSFQKAHLIDQNDGPGDATRRALVLDYMKLEGTTLPPGAHVETHGCGQTHPLPETVGDPPNSPKNRRVEVFLFEGDVEPPPQKRCPPAPGCVEYQQWVDRKSLDVDLEAPPGSLKVSVADKAGAPVTTAVVHASGPLPMEQPGADVTFADVVPGSYKVIANADGFESADATVEVASGAAASVALVLPKKKSTRKFIFSV